MATCKARVFSDDPSVTIDANHHISGQRAVPETFSCVWPAGHERGGTKAPPHHSSASAVWDDPEALDRTVLTDEEKKSRAAELRAELAELEGKGK